MKLSKGNDHAYPNINTSINGNTNTNTNTNLNNANTNNNTNTNHNNNFNISSHSHPLHPSQTQTQSHYESYPYNQQPQQQQQQKQPHQQQQIFDKVQSFKNNIRSKQRQTIFDHIRKQYQFVYTNVININKSKSKNNNNNNCNQNTSTFTQQQKQQQHQQQQYYQIQQFPLISRTFSKYHNIPHQQLSYELQQLSNCLIQSNIYLSIFQQQSLNTNTNTHIQGDNNNGYEDMSQQHNSNSNSNNNNYNDQQSLLIHDLFYLTFQHQNRFKFPRKYKFIRNGSRQVAAYVAVISTSIMPDQLAYWMQYMDDQDKQLVYLSILFLSQQQQQQQQQWYSPSFSSLDRHSSNHNQSHNQHLYYLAWVNHPLLRNQILQDFPCFLSAVRVIKEIVGFRGVHPDRFRDRNGCTLREILEELFLRELEGMKQRSSNNGGRGGTSRDGQLSSQHLQLAVKIIQAKLQDFDQDQTQTQTQKNNNTNNLLFLPSHQHKSQYTHNIKQQHHEPRHQLELLPLLSRILSTKIQSQTQLITPLFIRWVIDAYLNKNNSVKVLDCVGYRIVIQMVQYDPQKFISFYHKASQNVNVDDHSNSSNNNHNKEIKYNGNGYAKGKLSQNKWKQFITKIQNQHLINYSIQFYEQQQKNSYKLLINCKNSNQNIRKDSQDDGDGDYESRNDINPNPNPNPNPNLDNKSKNNSTNDRQLY